MPSLPQTLKLTPVRMRLDLLSQEYAMWLLLVINLVGKIAALLIGRAAPAAALVCWLLPDALLGYHLFAPRAQGLGRMCRRFSTARREVWLTIDDGPDPADTPQI